MPNTGFQKTDFTQDKSDNRSTSVLDSATSSYEVADLGSQLGLNMGSDGTVNSSTPSTFIPTLGIRG